MTTQQRFPLFALTLVTVFLAMILNVLSVILDIVVLSVWFPPKYDYPGKNTAYTTNRFAAVMAIFNLIFRYECDYLYCLIKTGPFTCMKRFHYVCLDFRAISTAVLFKVSKARDDFDGTPATNRSAVDGGRPISQISNNNGELRALLILQKCTHIALIVCKHL